MTIDEAKAMIREKCPNLSKSDVLKLARLSLRVHDAAWHVGYTVGHANGVEQGERIPGW